MVDVAGILSKVEKLTDENAALRAQVAKLLSENHALRERAVRAERVQFELAETVPFHDEDDR